MSSGGIRDKIQQMRAVVIRPPILVWDEKIWNGDIPSEEQIQAQIKSRTAYYCRICFS
jgi:ABC-type bacteriocin/lantibiotic exporter with double-glycine peptidase domain